MDEVFQVVDALYRAVADKRTVALCIVVDKKGAAPRDAGAKMLVFPDGSTVGTVGGGPYERLMVAEALKALNVGKGRVVKFSFEEKSPEGYMKTGLICGGEAIVYIDVIKPRPRLIIFGAGHIGQPLAKVADISGYAVYIVDDEKELATKERFPMAEKIFVGDYDKMWDEIKISADDAVAIVHGDLGHDLRALEKVVSTDIGYIGLLGSLTKIQRFKERLKQRGVDLEKLGASFHGPIGLDIGAENAGEIAVSIMAEIIKSKTKPSAE